MENRKSEILAKMEAELKEWAEKLKELKERVTDEETKARVRHELHELEEKAEAARERLKVMWEARGEAWEEMRAGAERTWAELSAMFERTFEKLRGGKREE